jgi:hypothetical protein
VNDVGCVHVTAQGLCAIAFALLETAWKELVLRREAVDRDR